MPASGFFNVEVVHKCPLRPFFVHWIWGDEACIMTHHDHSQEREPLAHPARLLVERGRFIFDGTPFVPKIYDGAFGETVPEGFNAVTLSLDASLHSSLAWEDVREYARALKERGLLILWELDLGLFSHLLLPLGDTLQLKAFGFALDHFYQTVWTEFKKETLGVSLYRGSLDFSVNFPWTADLRDRFQKWLQGLFKTPALFASETSVPCQSFEELVPPLFLANPSAHQLLRIFCNEVAVKYLNLLSSRFPDECAGFLLLDAQGLSSPFHLLQLLSRGRFEHYHTIVKGASIPLEALTWSSGRSVPCDVVQGFLSRGLLEVASRPIPSVGLCLPSAQRLSPSTYDDMEEVILRLKEKGIAFRAVSESQLTQEWDGLDYLVVLPQGLSSQTMRTLQGFCAAGGTVVNLGSISLNLPLETSFSNFLQ